MVVKEIRVHDRRRIIPTYRIPATVRAIPRKVGGTSRCANQLTVAAPALDLAQANRRVASTRQRHEGTLHCALDSVVQPDADRPVSTRDRF